MNPATATHEPVTNPVRIGNRRKVCVPGRLTWRDSSGALRFVSVVTRDVSDVDAFVECQVPASIPLYRLVHFQIERSNGSVSELPPALKNGKVLSAIYRVGPYKSSTGTPQGYALRLLVEPGRAVAAPELRGRMAGRKTTRRRAGASMRRPPVGSGPRPGSLLRPGTSVARPSSPGSERAKAGRRLDHRICHIAHRLGSAEKGL